MANKNAVVDSETWQNWFSYFFQNLLVHELHIEVHVLRQKNYSRSFGEILNLLWLWLGLCQLGIKENSLCLIRFVSQQNCSQFLASTIFTNSSLERHYHHFLNSICASHHHY